MDFYEVINKRRTIRSFSDDKVPEETIIKVLDAGIKAPTHNHLREWDFILIKDPKVRLNIVKAEGIPENIVISNFEESFSNIDNIAKEMYLDAIPKQKSMLVKAPELLVIVFKPKTKIKDSNSVYDLNCLSSAWCCIENILLALAAEDLYGVTYIPQKGDEIKQVLGIPPHLEIAALIPFGYKAKDLKIISQKSINLKEKIHFDKW
ncbi:MAG: nitroreductase family protein [bacterium]